MKLNQFDLAAMKIHNGEQRFINTDLFDKDARYFIDKIKYVYDSRLLLSDYYIDDYFDSSLHCWNSKDIRLTMLAFCSAMYNAGDL